MIAGDLGNEEVFGVCVGEDIVDDCILLTLAGEDLGDESISFSAKSHSIYVYVEESKQNSPLTKTTSKLKSL